MTTDDNRATAHFEGEYTMNARKQIVLRVQPGVNNGVRRAAKAAGVSINEYAQRVLARSAGVKIKPEPK